MSDPTEAITNVASTLTVPFTVLTQDNMSKEKHEQALADLTDGEKARAIAGEDPA